MFCGLPHVTSEQPVSSGCWGRGDAASPVHLWLPTHGSVCPALKNHHLWQLLVLLQQAALIFLSPPRIIGGVSVIATAQGFTLSMDPWRHSQQKASALLQTSELPLQLTPKKRLFLLYLPKFMHHLSCPERHITVKKLTVLDFLSWNPIIFFSISWAELYLEMFQPR